MVTPVPILFETPTSATFITPLPHPHLSIATPQPLIIDTEIPPHPVQKIHTATNNATENCSPSTPTLSSHSTTHTSTSTALAQTAAPTHGLIPEAKIGIGVTVGVLAFAIIFLGMLEGCYFRRKRREAAMKNAVEEVERGVDKGSEERIVLESRVSIVVDDGLWDEFEDDEGPRNGMSVSRRE
jgi:hypothetical protein